MSLALDTGFPTCAPDDLVVDVATRIDGQECLVLNEEGVVLRRLRLKQQHAAEATAVV